ncbi:MFS transporter [Streptomyces griseomycini]|uniref:EmrB/QacA subfamily drug resistance transporter n=1 Tax=Streptomyces griseomycini TaxID=66895 RepID=A0A7W7LVC5_9ACTN|nr:MFS transporter [Streptomyces griseomycini]MBB4897145.1 EmrB/QacA subfamily drug resistance transporter [Streptomyces griseomycini]GGP93483.1 MFS transporter [Streptomyces griseomycini]GGR34369.1 MFS transporter [Streptomyces griseomycini]
MSSSTSVDHSAARRGNPWLALIAVSFGLLMVQLDGSVVAIANPAIGKDLRAGTAELQWVTNSYLLALAASMILGGKLGDRFGRRRYYLVGVGGFAVTSVAIGLAGSIEGVIAFRALQGLCGGILMPNTLGILRAVFPPGKFGLAVGIWGMVSAVSTSLGPIIGGLLVEHVDWTWVFYLNAPIGIVALLFSAAVLAESRNSGDEQRFDVVGVVVLAAGLLALVFGIVKGETWGWTSAGTLGSIAAGLVLLVLFGRYETRQAHPLLPMRLFRDRSLTTGAVMTGLNFFVMLGGIFFVMLYLQNVRGYTPVEAGVSTLPMSLASLFASPIGSWLTARFGPRVTIPLGLVLSAAAMFGMLTWTTDSSYATMWPPYVALGLGVGVVLPATAAAIIGNAPVRDGGVASGLQSTMLQIGGALGTSVLVTVIAGKVGSSLFGELTGAGVPASLAHDLEKAGDAVAMGIAPVSADMPAQLRAAVVEGSGQAFVGGLHSAVVVTGILCLIGAVAAVAGIRSRAQEARDGEEARVVAAH